MSIPSDQPLKAWGLRESLAVLLPKLSSLARESEDGCGCAVPLQTWYNRSQALDPFSIWNPAYSRPHIRGFARRSCALQKAQRSASEIVRQDAAHDLKTINKPRSKSLITNLEPGNEGRPGCRLKERLSVRHLLKMFQEASLVSFERCDRHQTSSACKKNNARCFVSLTKVHAYFDVAGAGST